MKNILLTILFLVLLFGLTNAVDQAIHCSDSSTIGADGAYNCVVENANAPVAFGVGQNAAQIVINQIEWTDGTNPLDTVNLEIRNANVVFPRGTELAFSSRKFNNIIITGSRFELNSISLQATQIISIRNTHLNTSSQVTIFAPNTQIEGGSVTTRQFRINTDSLIGVHADGTPLLPDEVANLEIGDKIISVQPQYLNLTNGFIVNQVQWQGRSTDVSLITKGALKLSGVNWAKKLGSIEATGNLLDANIALNASKVKIQIVENLTGRITAYTENEITLASGKNIDLNTGQQVGDGLNSSNGFISITGGENVTIRGEITSGGMYAGVNANRLSPADSLLNLVDLQWKNKSGIFIKAGKTLTLNGNAITAKEYIKRITNYELEHSVAPIELIERPDGNTAVKLYYYQLPSGNGATAPTKAIITLTNETIINYQTTLIRGAIGVKRGQVTCEYFIKTNENNQILAAAIVRSGNNIIDSNLIHNVQLPFSVEMTNSSCTFKTGSNGVQLTHNFDAQPLEQAATMQVGYTDVNDDINYGFSPALKIEYVNSKPAITLSAETLNLNVGLLNATGVSLIKAIQLNTRLAQNRVFPSTSKVVSCNDDHTLNGLFDPILTTMSGICPSARKMYLYGQLSRGGVNITSGAIKATQIINLRNGHYVTYTLGGLTQNWNATFNNAFNENGTFNLTLGAGPNNVNPTLITEGGRHEVTLTIDPQSPQFNCEAYPDSCIVQPVVVNVQ